MIFGLHSLDRGYICFVLYCNNLNHGAGKLIALNKIALFCCVKTVISRIVTRCYVSTISLMIFAPMILRNKMTLQDMKLALSSIMHSITYRQSVFIVET